MGTEIGTNWTKLEKFVTFRTAKMRIYWKLPTAKTFTRAALWLKISYQAYISTEVKKYKWIKTLTNTKLNPIRRCLSGLIRKRWDLSCSGAYNVSTDFDFKNFILSSKVLRTQRPRAEPTNM